MENLNYKYIKDHYKLKDMVNQCKKEGKKIVFTNGCFDLLHVGHIRCLRDAKNYGDILILAINSDKSVKNSKGKDRPIINELERLELLSELNCIDYITLFDEPTVDSLLLLLKPDFHAKGTDYTIGNVPERETVMSYGGQIAIVGDSKNHSSTEIIKKTGKIFFKNEFPSDFCTKLFPRVKIIYKKNDLKISLEDILNKEFKNSIKDKKGYRDVVKLNTSNGKLYFLKRYIKLKSKDYFKIFFPIFKSKSHVEFDNYKILSNIGISIPEILAWGEERNFFFPKKSFLITANVSGESLDIFLKNNKDKNFREQILNYLAILIRRLHVARISYLDLKAKHIFIQKDGNIKIIDPFRLEKKFFIKNKHIAKEFANLYRSIPLENMGMLERIKFFKFYTGKEILDKKDKKIIKLIKKRVNNLNLSNKWYKRIFLKLFYKK